MFDPAENIEALKTELPSLNLFLRGGLKWGSVCEIGLHSGQWGCSLVLEFLKNQSGFDSLWVYPEGELIPYPPAWAAQGVDLNHLHFMEYSGELSHLRSVFLEPFFSMVILDQPKKLSTGLLSAWASLVRKNKQILFLIRPYYLKPDRGNPFANYRFNIAFCFAESSLRLFPIKGVGPEELILERSLEF